MACSGPDGDCDSDEYGIYQVANWINESMIMGTTRIILIGGRRSRTFRDFRV